MPPFYAATRGYDGAVNPPLHMPNFRRKRIRLPRAAYRGRRWYFVTLCAANRRNWFVREELVNTLLRVLRETCQTHGFNVFAYCFMPDHLHLELEAISDHSDLISMLAAFKGLTAAEARKQGLRNLWQKSFYEHIFRSGEREGAVAWYIFSNPVRRGLVSEPRAWPYSGSWMFDWKKAVAPVNEFVPPWKVAG